MQAARSLLHEQSGIREWTFIRKSLAKVERDESAVQTIRVALLSSFSIDFLHSPLIACGFVNGLDVHIYQSGFSQFRQDVVNAASGLYEFAPDVVVLAVEGKDWIPELYSTSLQASEVAVDAALHRVRQEVASLLEIIRNRSKATILLHNFSQPIYPALGILDLRSTEGQSLSVLKLNQWMAEYSRELVGTYVLDYAGLVAKYGAFQWYDQRLDHIAAAPIRMEALPYLAAEYMKFFRALTGRTRKCLITDLDNTLWGGVLGEVGLHGIELGTTYPGSAFMEFQKVLSQLQRRGVLLAIASKNNSEDVDQVFAQHPHMILRREQFASMQVNWKRKSDSVREISSRLDISPDHMVFVDDNPAECEEVSNAIPMVRTICLPAQPEQFVHAVLEEGLFDSLSYSLEDSRRTELYRQREQAAILRDRTGTLEDFYHSLQMNAVFSPVRAATLARAAQLTQKTNQFNATTRRYTESQLADLTQNPDWILTTVTVRDRFGDNGIVGLMFATLEDRAMEIDTFLLSCRVIGRSIETAMLAYLCKETVARGLCELRGRVVPTAKNDPVRDLFSKGMVSAKSLKTPQRTAAGCWSWPTGMCKHRIGFQSSTNAVATSRRR